MSDKRPTLSLNLENAAPNPARIPRAPAVKAGRTTVTPNKHAWADAALRDALAAAGDNSPA